ncbi:MAG: A/G-specific adenine glycosylase [Promethearchaeota archaeon]
MSKNNEDVFITDFYKQLKESGLTFDLIHLFQTIILKFYKNFKRNFPFRKEITPYYVVVSEIMLQQTQTDRVSKKFLEFIKKFPDFFTLSKTPLDDVLKAWQGLGYNRRAIALKKISEIMVNDYNGVLPDSIETLKTFPQIGHNTACSIVTFAFNKPTVFIETNIRRVYIYFFFPGKNNVTDREIMPIVEKTINRENPREWYYALMDYGVMLKKKYPDLNKRSANYRKQAPFKGSSRQIRGEILRILVKKKMLSLTELEKKLNNVNLQKLKKILGQLEKEGFIKLKREIIQIVN